jgi:hypothetical protein
MADRVKPESKPALTWISVSWRQEDCYPEAVASRNQESRYRTVCNRCPFTVYRNNLIMVESSELRVFLHLAQSEFLDTTCEKRTGGCYFAIERKESGEWHRYGKSLLIENKALRSTGPRGPKGSRKNRPDSLPADSLRVLLVERVTGKIEERESQTRGSSYSCESAENYENGEVA